MLAFSRATLGFAYTADFAAVRSLDVHCTLRWKVEAATRA